MAFRAPSSIPSTPPSLEEIQSWLDTTCMLTAAESFIGGAESYCVYLVNRFTDTSTPSLEEFNAVSDSWVQNIAEQELIRPMRVEFILGMCTACFNDAWVSTRLGRTLRSLGVETPSGTGKSLLFAYLAWRYERRIDELLQIEGLSETIENVQLDG
ncbi:hypothetical protein ANO14919_080200 [Xylariales sp. No.14919]|nr:hypothetical protein F5X98DRAFT_379946 [Xylaria grammica]GAW18544.1 hypothetical protein ANO14919_080200 [Xylariales sp. No.14919]